MRANVFIVHRNDGLLRALTGMLVAEGYRVHRAERIDVLLPELERAGRPAVVVIDDEAAGPGWREELGRFPHDVSRVVLTWYPWVSFPPDVTPLAKPFRARELIDLLAAKVASGEPRPGRGR